jgi:ferredoxin-NADP reductase/ferredoxin
MMEDLKKYQKAEKLKKQREESQSIPWYYDGLEKLCDRVHPETQLVKITDIKDLSYDTKLYRFISVDPDKPLAPFRAGRYIGLTVEINGVRTTRPYSLVSSPNQLAYYELGIRRKEDGFLTPYFLDNAKIGDIYEVTEPLGDLYYNPLFHGKDLVFIAGGCGITPFISLLRDIYERALDLNVWLIYGCVTEKDIIFREEIEDIAEKRSNITVKYILSEPDPDWKGESGFITADKILNAIGSIKDKYFYVVGNRPMYQFLKGEMKKLGVPNHKVYYEAFGVPDDITQVLGWPQEIDKSKKIKISVKYRKFGKIEKMEFEGLCVEPLLNSIERTKELGLSIDSACRSGACAWCRTKMISGKVFVPPEVTIREADKDYGFIHPCVSYPLTDIELDLTLT